MAGTPMLIIVRARDVTPADKITRPYDEFSAEEMGQWDFRKNAKMTIQHGDIKTPVAVGRWLSHAVSATDGCVYVVGEVTSEAAKALLRTRSLKNVSLTVATELLRHPQTGALYNAHHLQELSLVKKHGLEDGARMPNTDVVMIIDDSELKELATALTSKCKVAAQTVDLDYNAKQPVATAGAASPADQRGNTPLSTQHAPHSTDMSTTAPAGDPEPPLVTRAPDSMTPVNEATIATSLGKRPADGAAAAPDAKQARAATSAEASDATPSFLTAEFLEKHPEIVKLVLAQQNTVDRLSAQVGDKQRDQAELERVRKDNEELRKQHAKWAAADEATVRGLLQDIASKLKAENPSASATDDFTQSSSALMAKVGTDPDLVHQMQKMMTVVAQAFRSGSERLQRDGLVYQQQIGAAEAARQQAVKAAELEQLRRAYHTTFVGASKSAPPPASMYTTPPQPAPPPLPSQQQAMSAHPSGGGGGDISAHDFVAGLRAGMGVDAGSGWSQTMHQQAMRHAFPNRGPPK